MLNLTEKQRSGSVSIWCGIWRKFEATDVRASSPRTVALAKATKELLIVALMISGLIWFYHHVYQPSHQSGNSVSTTQSPGNPHTEGGSTTAAIRLNQKFTNGSFSVVVKKVKCGISFVGPGGQYGIAALGQFCALKVSITNISSEPANFGIEGDLLIDSKGREFSASNDADIWGNGESGWAGVTVNPTFSSSGIIYFDIPKNDTPSKLDFYSNYWGFPPETTVSLN